MQFLPQEEQNKSGIASDLNFNISTASWNCLNTDRLESTSSFNGLNSANNGFDLDLVGKEKDSKVDDFDWEFRGAELQRQPKDGNAEVLAASWIFFFVISYIFLMEGLSVITSTSTFSMDDHILGCSK